jgi:hypothetical protein
MKKYLILLGIILSLQAISQPDWKVINYTNSTTAYGKVTINKDTLAAAGDKVGAFVSGECRAIGDVIMSAGVAFVTLQIQGEKTETVIFKIWHKSTNTIHNVKGQVNTSPGGIIGYPPNYVVISSSIQIKKNDDLKLYPNPFNSGIYIKSPREFKSIVIYNQTGQMVVQQHDQLDFICTDKLLKGIYLVQITDKNGNSFFTKMLK